jgi:hypothetical protein
MAAWVASGRAQRNDPLVRSMQMRPSMLRALILVLALVFVGLGLLGVAFMGVGGIAFYAIAMVLVVIAAASAMKKRHEPIQTKEL